MISILPDLLIAFSAIVAARAAWLGLSGWRSQKRWEVDHELARRFLINLYKYRDAIAGVRNAVMWAHEMPSPSKEKADKMSIEQIRFYGTAEAYTNRWQKVIDSRLLIYADLTEAEALWGILAKDHFNQIYKLEVELSITIQSYLRAINPDNSDDERAAASRILESKRDIKYDTSGAGEEFKDEFHADFKLAMEPLEKLLKEKLGR